MEINFLPIFYDKLCQILNADDSSVHIKDNSDNYQELLALGMPIHSAFKEMEIIPLDKTIIHYSDDEWYLGQYNPMNNGRSTIYFDDCPECFKDVLKDYVIILMLKGKYKLRTIIEYVNRYERFFDVIYDCGVTDLKELDDSDFDAFVASFTVTNKATIQKNLAPVGKFLQYYDTEYGTSIYSKTIRDRCENFNYRYYNALVMNGQKKPIPDIVFNKILSYFIKRMHDTKLSNDERGKAAMMVIDMQVGLRVSELSMLDVDALHLVSDVGNVKVYKLEYKIIKGQNNDLGYKIAYTYVNDITYDAYNIATEMYKENRDIIGVNYLCFPSIRASVFCVANKDNPENNKRMGIEYFENYFKGTCLKHAEEFGLYDPSLKEYLKETTVDGKTVYYPTFHQNRHTVAYKLMEAHVPADVVAKYFGHLDVEITDGYAAPAYREKTEKELAKDDFLDGLINGEVPLGPNAAMVKKGFEEFKQKYGNDAEILKQKGSEELSVRAKECGFCVKAAFGLSKECDRSNQTDEILCYIGKCPNVMYFYYNADVSYINYKNIMIAVEHNNIEGYIKEAQREQMKADSILLNRLKPEVEQLEIEIQNKGIDNILKEHPNLSDVVDNLEKIKIAITKAQESFKK